MDTFTVEVVRRINESWGFNISNRDFCVIDNVKEDSPAYEAGLQKGDRVISVNGIEISQTSHQHVSQLIADSRRIVRLKIVPNTNNLQSLPSAYHEEETFWTNEDPSILYCSARCAKPSAVEGRKDDDIAKLDLTEFETYCNLLQQTMDSKQKNNNMTNDGDQNREAKMHKKHRKKETKETGCFEKVEQSSFVVTRETQKDFDENYVPEGTFQGRKASVAGAFTGDHNQILGESSDDIRGIRARVTAGIQHFSFEDEQEKIKAADKGKIILYTTSLSINRSIAQRCEQVRNIFKGFRVKFEDRDIFSSAEHKDELYRRLGLSDGAAFPHMPRVYLDGVFIGGAAEVQAMSDCGDLRIRLKEFSKFNIRTKCPTCNATGSITCHSCQGETFRRKNRFAVLKCSTCGQKGFLPCPDCL